jgi:hypothetical protein
MKQASVGSRLCRGALRQSARDNVAIRNIGIL